MKEQQESKPKKPNILVRLIALLVTAALLLGALVLVVYRDRLNLDALARWFEYRNLETSESGEAVPFSHAGGRQANFAYLDSGVLLASDTGARYYSFSGELYAEEVRNLEQPVLTHSSGYGVVYDAGGQDLFLFSGVEEAFHLTLDSGELLSARVNDSGWLAVTSHGGGWRGLVTVYDSSYNTEEPPSRSGCPPPLLWTPPSPPTARRWPSSPWGRRAALSRARSVFIRWTPRSPPR